MLILGFLAGASAGGLTWERVIEVDEDGNATGRAMPILWVRGGALFSVAKLPLAENALETAGNGLGFTASAAYAHASYDEFTNHAPLWWIPLAYKHDGFADGTTVDSLSLGFGSGVPYAVAPRWIVTPFYWELSLGAGALGDGSPELHASSDPVTLAAAAFQLEGNTVIGARLDTPPRVSVDYSFRWTAVESDMHADRWLASRGIAIGGILVDSLLWGLLFPTTATYGSNGAESHRAGGDWVPWAEGISQVALLVTYIALNGSAYNWPWDDPQPVQFGSQQLVIGYSIPLQRHVNE